MYSDTQDKDEQFETHKKKIGDSLDKLKLEIKILSRLHHPNICKYYETHESPKHVYIIMENCKG